MNRVSILPSIVLASTALLGPQAIAASYNEAVDGDLKNHVTPDAEPLLMTLDGGTNHVIGSATWSYDGMSDFDGFNFSVSNGFSLDAVLLTISGAEGTGLLEQIGWELKNSDGGIHSQQLAQLSMPAREMFKGSLPAGAGTYSLNLNSFAGTLGAGEFRSFDYHLRLNVSPVPEPTSALLLVGGAAVTLPWGLRRARARSRG